MIGHSNFSASRCTEIVQITDGNCMEIVLRCFTCGFLGGVTGESGL